MPAKEEKLPQGIAQPVLIVELERIYQQISSINRKLKRIETKQKEDLLLEDDPYKVPF